MKRALTLSLILTFITLPVLAQTTQQMVDQIVAEAENNSRLEVLAHELLDVVGPRLVGTPQQQIAHDWAVDRFKGWGIEAENEQFGQWRGWKRGVTHIDLIEPRVVSLSGMQLAWSPSGGDEPITAEVIHLPEWESEEAFAEWLPTTAGKIVLVSQSQITGRPDYNWEEWATEESFEAMKTERREQAQAFNENIRRAGQTTNSLIEAVEQAGAVAVFQSRWSYGFGVNKVFSARTNTIPMIDVSQEDYGLLWRLAEHGNEPVVRLFAPSEELGKVPTFNTIATIPGTEKPDEYIILSAHFDSWDGGTGATDNGTGTITMMETARILKKLYPNPKRTIIVGLWGSEEQGLNGSGAYVQDHPEVVEGLQALFNQDNGTGRVVRLSGQGFLHAYEYLGRWMEAVPRELSSRIETTFPGIPSGGGSDYASFVSAGAPAFSLSSLSWDYGTYTWHTNLDTYDKIVFDDVRDNVILTAILTYMASEDPEKIPRDKAVLGINPRTGEPRTWPEPRRVQRDGGN